MFYGDPAGGSDPTTNLLLSPRFTGIGATPPAPTAPAVTPRPVTPNVDASGNPIGLAVLGGFPSFLQFDKNFKTPYSDTFSLGIQRELKGNVVVEVNYFGRLGRRLIADGDAAQTLNFKDPASGQLLKNAFGQLQTQIQKGLPITAQPWFENQMTAAGFPCTNYAPNCTDVVAQFFSNFVTVGDLSSTILELSRDGLLNPNVGLYAQTGANGYIGNYSSSSYNALLASVRKRYSNNLQIDFNYSYSHSIDNQSNIINDANQFSFSGQGLICDLTDLRTCRADSLFDARHIISANYVYDLPLGARPSSSRGDEQLGEHDRGRMVDLGHPKLPHGLPVHDAHRDVPDQLHAGRSSRFQRGSAGDPAEYSHRPNDRRDPVFCGSECGAGSVQLSVRGGYRDAESGAWAGFYESGHRGFEKLQDALVGTPYGAVPVGGV